MKRNFIKSNIIGILSILFLSTCTTTRMVRVHQTESPKNSLNLSDIQKRIKNKRMQVTMRDGIVFQGTIVQIEADYSRFQIQKDKPECVVPTCHIFQIEKANQWDSAIGRCFQGMIGGGLLCWIYSSMEIPNGAEMEGLGILIFTLGGATGGGVLCLIDGAFHGYHVIYQFSEEPGDSITTKIETKTP